MKKIFLIIFVLASPLKSFADFNADARGTTAADFLKLGVGARAGAMGNAYTAAADDATALYWNPAALTRISPKAGSATLMHAPYVASSFFDYVGYAKNLSENASWGTSLQYFSAGSITQTDESGFTQGSFTPYDLALSVGGAHEFENFSLGLNLKYIRSQIVSSASTFAVDMGVLSRPFLSQRLRLAAVASNVGGKLKYDKDSSRLPTVYRVGGAFQMTKWWLIDTDVVFPIDDSPYLAAGAEHLWPIGRSWSIAARAG